QCQAKAIGAASKTITASASAACVRRRPYTMSDSSAIVEFPCLRERLGRREPLSGNYRAAISVFLHKHSARNSQIPPFGVILGGHPDRPRFVAQEQASQLSDAARHHSGHDHVDRRDRSHPCDEPVYRREGL